MASHNGAIRKIRRIMDLAHVNVEKKNHFYTDYQFRFVTDILRHKIQNCVRRDELCFTKECYKQFHIFRSGN